MFFQFDCRSWIRIFHMYSVVFVCEIWTTYSILAVQQGCLTHEVPTAHHTTHPAFGAYSICKHEGYTAHTQSLITWDDVLSVSWLRNLWHQPCFALYSRCYGSLHSLASTKPLQTRKAIAGVPCYFPAPPPPTGCQWLEYVQVLPDTSRAVSRC
jgi:hypothetical protein